MPIEPMAARSELKIARPPSIGETQMKKIVLAVALVVAFAAPAMADNFVNPYATTLGR
jgi:hypothetical protein